MYTAEQLARTFDDMQALPVYKLVVDRLDDQELGKVLKRTLKIVKKGGLKRRDGKPRTTGGVFFYTAKGMYGLGLTKPNAKKSSNKRWSEEKDTAKIRYENRHFRT